MTEGQKVICISEDFPHIKKYGGVEQENVDRPKLNEVLIIDEVLGEFLRFEKYDTVESFNWWIRPFDEREELLKNLEEKVGGKVTHIHLVNI